MSRNPSQLADPSLHILRLPEQRAIVEKAVAFFDGTPLHPLPPDRFTGTGVYALYYNGDFEPYARLAAQNIPQARYPIYVGKAVGEGWRTARSSGGNSIELWRRLGEHASSIRSTTSLKLPGFQCRFMIMVGDESDLIGSVEARLIRKYSPLWNSIVDGFGNHDPGKGRYEQAVSEWDALHEGRAWVRKLMGARPSVEAIAAAIRRELEQSEALPQDIQREADDQTDQVPPE